ncbi:MAG: carboxypeptidase-like regulatory domain-containing protein [Ignavibacteriae bacterium]|nr:carboxypeptidase-like regulatory domain-containing protein [Ignavibacteriota bacterium]
MELTKKSILIDILLNIFFSLLFVYISFAELKPPLLTGKVIDGSTGEIMRGASVYVVGTKWGARTDIKGEFKIKVLNPGIYTVKVSYIGYVAKEVYPVNAIDGQTTDLSTIIIKPQSNLTEEITVQGERIMSGEGAVLAQRKNAEQVSDGISAEEIKKTPDSDAGQSLRRITGVTLVGGKYVFIRGVSERYNNTTLNGTSLASTEPDKKAFAFDIFPSEFLDYASIAKSYTPNLPGNFAGGLVQLNTIDFPQGFSVKLSISQAYNDIITFKDKSFHSFNSKNNELFGLGSRNINLPDGIPTSPSEMSQLMYSQVKSQDRNTRYESQQQWEIIGNEFNNNSWKRDTLTAPLNGSYKLTFTDIFELGGNDFGIIASGLMSGEYTNNRLSRGVLLSDGEYKFYGNGLQSTYSKSLGGILNFAYKIGTDNSISWKNIYNNSIDNEMVNIVGKKEESYIKQISYDNVQKTLIASQLAGEHLLPILQNSILKWNLGYSNSIRNEPDFRRLRYSRNDTAEPYRIDIGNNPQGNGTLAGRYFSNLNEDAYSGGLNLVLKFPEVKVEFGGLYEQKNRQFLVRSFTIIKSESIIKNFYDTTYEQDLENWTDDYIYGLLNTETAPELLFENQNFNLHGFGISEDSHERDSYRADEGVLAAYAMADYSIELFKNKLRFIGGFRVEKSNQKLQSYFPLQNNNGIQDEYDIYVNQNYIDILPSLNMIYELNKNMNLRVSASKTLTRPTLREYAPFTFYDFKTQVNVKGNPYLQRSLIQNYDIRWELFPNPGEVFSISGFYKIFDNAIEETILPSPAEIFRSYDNAKGKAYNYGVEFEARLNLDFISDILRDFSFNSNLALIKSVITVNQVNQIDTRSMCGQSPYTINLNLNYNKLEWGTAFNLSYNTYGKRIVQVADITKYQFSNPHIYELPRNVFDFTVSQVLLDMFELRFVARDIFNEKLVWMQGGHEVLSNYYGRDYSLSLSYKIQ